MSLKPIGLPRYHSRSCAPPRPVGTAPPRPPPRAPPAGGAAEALPLRALAMAVLSRSRPDWVSYIFMRPLWLYATDPRYPGDQPSMKACVYTPGIPHLVICAISQLPNHGSSAKRIGSRFGFCGGPPVYVYNNGCASCRSCMIGGNAVKYQSTIARICTSLMLMSRLLSWYTYLPQ